MKKFLKTLLVVLSFFLFKEVTTIKAQETGTCIIKAKDKTYNVNTPFYWYSITKENIVDETLKAKETYTFNEQYITNQESCTGINNSKISREQPYKKNALSYKIETYYFSSSRESDAKNLFTKSENTFYIPTMIDNPSFITISSTFISFDDLPPVIVSDSLEGIIITSMTNHISIEALKAKISAYDEVDGVTSINVDSDNYSPNKSILGEYEVTFSSSDKSGNTSYLTIKIKVIDNIKPTITGPSSLTSNMSNLLSLDDIKSKLTISDNYDQNITSRLIIEENNYSNNTNKEGSFTITFSVTDLSNNKSDNFIISINIYDDIAPTLRGKAEYITSYKEKLNLEDIKNNLIYSDNITKNSIIEILSDNYSSFYYLPGEYEINYIAKDNNNNTSIPFIVKVTVQDSEKPIFYISQKFISVDASSNIPIEEIIEILEVNNSINKENLISSSIILDNYSNNKDIPGEYEIKLCYEYENENIILEASVVVENLSTQENNKKTPKKSLWSIIKNFLISIWTFIKKIFSFLLV